MVADFSAFGALPARKIAVLFAVTANTGHADIGFIMITDGSSNLQSSQKVLYATVQMSALHSAAALYTFQMLHLETLDGSSLISDLLYPGTLPGSKMPFPQRS